VQLTQRVVDSCRTIALILFEEVKEALELLRRVGERDLHALEKVDGAGELGARERGGAFGVNRNSGNNGAGVLGIDCGGGELRATLGVEALDVVVTKGRQRERRRLRKLIQRGFDGLGDIADRSSSERRRGGGGTRGLQRVEAKLGHRRGDNWGHRRRHNDRLFRDEDGIDV
jgi:hypothetical protein